MTGVIWAVEGAAENSSRQEIQRIANMILAGPGLQSAEWGTTVAGMERPVEVELPHKLGREEARRRIANNVHKLHDHIPGGAAQVLPGIDQVNSEIVALTLPVHLAIAWALWKRTGANGRVAAEAAT